MSSKKHKKSVSSEADRRGKLILREAGVANASPSANAVGDEFGVDSEWDFARFEANFDVRIVSLTDRELEFDLIGIDASIANAIRRVMISEVPSMAIEKAIIYQNTSLIQDEVLAHRLGLIPLKADPKFFQTKTPTSDDNLETSENDSLEFELKVKCTMNPTATKDMTDPDDIYRNHLVKTSDMKWLPIGLQHDMFKEKAVGPVESDILIAKLRPGQEIDVKMIAWKGIGRDHAKFMPATVWYRLLPQIELKEEIEGERAYRLAECFSPGVIKIDTSKGVAVARVEDARYDTCSRNVFLHDDLKDAVEMSKVLDHFIFTVESMGAQKPDVLICEAIKVMMSKCSTFLSYL